jgi:CRISPR-associated protein Csy2
MLIDKNDFASSKKPAGEGNKSGKSMGTLSLQPTATAHLSISVILEFEASEFSSWKNNVAVQFLNGARFAGGQIIRYREPQEHESLQAAMRQIGRGFLVTDRTDLLQGRSDPLEALVDALYGEREEEKQAWLCPTNLGYILAGEPRVRRGARQGLPHAWGEPLAGLVEFKSLRAALRQKNRLVAWSARWLNEFTWVVQQKELDNDHS